MEIDVHFGHPALSIARKTHRKLAEYSGIAMNQAESPLDLPALEKMRDFKKELDSGCAPANYRNWPILNTMIVALQPVFPKVGPSSNHEIMQVGNIPGFCHRRGIGAGC